MKVKETPWESRNLGVKSSVEFYIESNDSITDIIGTGVLDNDKYEYQVVHMPVGKVDVLNAFLNHGFWFAETKFELLAELKELRLPLVFDRFSSLLSYHKADENELKKILDCMKSGMFKTDKISLDRSYNEYVAGNRYALWTQDEINSGRGHAYVVTNSDVPIGFFILKKVNNRLGDSFLAGLYNKEKYAGFGFSVLYYPMVEAKRMGLKKIIAGVSSNNPDSVRMHMALGYQITKMNYTVIKHI